MPMHRGHNALLSPGNAFGHPQHRALPSLQALFGRESRRGISSPNLDCSPEGSPEGCNTLGWRFTSLDLSTG
ncbi:unnamed protein product [Ectocarpus sp. CCAP 1310/34]|nr:unnamed protein product [Ectocarpus sp. CCAP 1310/34]